MLQMDNNILSTKFKLTKQKLKRVLSFTICFEKKKNGILFLFGEFIITKFLTLKNCFLVLLATEE